MAYEREHFEAMTCPPDVNWTDNIKDMFTPLDVDHMEFKFDLTKYEDVKTNAVAIYGRVDSGSMPPPSSGEERWSAEKVNLFGCWIKQGTPEN